MGARGWGGRSGAFSTATSKGSDGNASGGDGGDEGTEERQGSASTAALQEVERAHGVGGEVTPAAPHRNSRVSKTTIEQLRARTDPGAWVGVSETAAEASFTAGTEGKDMEGLVHDYKRRRLSQRQERLPIGSKLWQRTYRRSQLGGERRQTWCRQPRPWERRVWLTPCR